MLPALPEHADFVFDSVVVGFQIVVSERPVFQG